MSGPFALSAVVHLVRPAGFTASNLEELRSGISGASERTLFYHAAQVPMRHPTATELPPDDLSGWVHGVVQDRETAERLSYAVLSRGDSATSLRAGLLEVLDAIPEKTRVSHDAPPDGEFVFLEVESVPVSTGLIVHDPHQLMAGLAEADFAAWFYHLIEERWFADARSPLIDWVQGFGETRLASGIEEEACSGRTLSEIRRRVQLRWQRTRLPRRLVQAAEEAEGDRREAGREAVSGLVRRLTRGQTPAAQPPVGAPVDGPSPATPPPVGAPSDGPAPGEPGSQA